MTTSISHSIATKDGSTEYVAEDAAPPEKRFIIRAVSSVVVPPAFAAYYIWTYVYYLAPSSDSTDDASRSLPDGRNRFGALSTDQIQMHQDKSWSKVSGWWAIGRRMVWRQPGDGPVLSPVWIPLFVLSILSWAFALSGLTMETRQTYRAGSDPGVSVVGSNATNFNSWTVYTVLDSAYHAWRLDQQPRLPLLGALYSIPGAPIGFNMTTGNELPPNTSVPLVLAPQAEVPVTGTAWGVALRYGCRPIYKLDDFKILSKRLDSKTPGYLNGTARGPGEEGPRFNPTPPEHYFYDVPGLPNATISVMSTDGWYYRTVAEVGVSSGIYNIIDEATRAYGADPGGLDTEEVLEFTLWQAHGFLGTHPETGTIPQLDGEYLTYYAGWARLNGLAGTFHDFRREDPGNTNEEGDRVWPLPRFSLAVPAMLLLGIRGHRDFNVIGLTAETRPDFPSVKDSAPWLPPDTFDYKYVENVTEFGAVDVTGPIYTAGQVPFDAADSLGSFYSQFATPENLQRALESAYKHVAVAMLYSQREMPYQAWTSLNLTAAVSRALLVLVVLSLWALGCMALGLAYSFRKRWDAYFTTRSLYWYCRKTANVDPMEVMKNTN
ncbi:hypothetical protein C8A01DRAFT_47229 [Parachaetomium inaequale]|uniref:Uncharacterized protein n=1 Tax=Parachaetomium inaequale TaxID=2588326 RepID=A0AAN6PE40_9PEZI|nr:hypothetical protein C8A01DRAFT_47229 [Parachaetomium inaequale]